MRWGPYDPIPSGEWGASLLLHTIYSGPAPQFSLTLRPSPEPLRLLTSAGQKALDPAPALYLCLTLGKLLPSLGLSPHLQSETTGCQLCQAQIYNPMTSLCLNPLSSLFFFYSQLQCI